MHALAGDTQMIRLWAHIQRLRRPGFMPRAGLPSVIAVAGLGMFIGSALNLVFGVPSASSGTATPADYGELADRKDDDLRFGLHV